MDQGDGQKRVGAEELPVVAVVRPRQSSTPISELLIQFVLLWGVFGGCWWVSMAFSAAGFALLMAFGHVWCAARAVDWPTGRGWTLLVTLSLMLATGWCAWASPAGIPGWMLRSPLSPAVLMGLLAGVLCVDFIAYRQRLLSAVSSMVRRRWLGIELLVVLALIWLVWSFGAALFFHARDMRLQGPVMDSEATRYGARVAFHAGEGLVTFCVLALGGNIGSFLNVLVYRLPRGLDVISSRSRCPDCGTAIAGRDNIPIFGWLFLGGRCRACGVEISGEYVRVEAASAGIFLLLYFAELLTGGLTIPFRPPNLYAGVLWTVMYPKFDLIGIWLLHVLLLATLLVYSRLQAAGQGVSLRATAILSTLVVLGSLVFPNLQPVSVTAVPGLVQGSGLRNSGAGVGGVFAALAGLFAGAAAGLSLWRTTRGVWYGAGGGRSEAGGLELSTAFRSPLVAGLVLAGVVLGWQAIVSTLVLLGCLGALTGWWTDRVVRVEWQRCSLLLVAVILQILSWRWQWGVMGVEG